MSSDAQKSKAFTQALLPHLHTIETEGLDPTAAFAARLEKIFSVFGEVYGPEELARQNPLGRREK